MKLLFKSTPSSSVQSTPEDAQGKPKASFQTPKLKGAGTPKKKPIKIEPIDLSKVKSNRSFLKLTMISRKSHRRENPTRKTNRPKRAERSESAKKKSLTQRNRSWTRASSKRHSRSQKATQNRRSKKLRRKLKKPKGNITNCYQNCQSQYKE